MLLSYEMLSRKLVFCENVFINPSFEIPHTIPKKGSEELEIQLCHVKHVVLNIANLCYKNSKISNFDSKVNKLTKNIAKIKKLSLKSRQRQCSSNYNKRRQY